MSTTSIIVTCEHAGNTVPDDFAHLFYGNESLLESAASYDPGAGEIAEAISTALQCFYKAGTTTRLLIDYNRALSNPDCFSKITDFIAPQLRFKLIDEYYLPWRNAIKAEIIRLTANDNQVLHFSIHTFTPEDNGKTRNAAIGILYDSAHHGEREIARVLERMLHKEDPELRVRMNYPWRGTNDSFTNFLRKVYTERNYLGIEIDCNQLMLEDSTCLAKIRTALVAAMQELKDYIQG